MFQFENSVILYGSKTHSKRISFTKEYITLKAENISLNKIDSFGLIVKIHNGGMCVDTWASFLFANGQSLDIGTSKFIWNIKNL